VIDWPGVHVVDEGTGNCGELGEHKNNVDKGGGAPGSMHECGEQDEKFLDEGVDDASGSMRECGELNKFVDEEGGASGSKQ
jgi:hypothetical protein